MSPPPDVGSRRAVVGTVVVAVLACLVTGAVSAWCSVLGCAPFEEDFEPEGRAATEARVVARDRVQDDLDALVPGRRVLAAEVGDRCTDGQYGWKRKDTWSHVCAVVADRVVAVPREDMHRTLRTLEVRAAQAGCRPSPGDAVTERLPAVGPDPRRPGEPLVLDLAPSWVGARYHCSDGTSSVEVRPVVGDEVAVPDSDDVGLLRVTRTLTYYRTAFRLRDRDRGSTVATVTPPGW